MRKIFSTFLCLLGVLILGYVLLSAYYLNTARLTGQVESKSVEQVDDASAFVYNAVVENNHPFPIRLCGGQLNWCDASGCYSVKTELPVTIEAKRKAVVTVQVTSGGENISATELVLYADGAGLSGLTPIKVQLPAMSKTSL
ncbi:MAG: hypothetical protein LBJ00_15885 [Planctomycetaceae bacterium]|jgi:hypothetical protein|nr:hypothetical protein [Planctomycetaceae bacterium]